MASKSLVKQSEREYFKKLRLDIGSGNYSNYEDNPKRDKLIKEFLQTEETYMNNLKIVVEYYFLPVQNNKILSMQESMNIFKEVPKIYSVNRRFYSDIKKVKHLTPEDFAKIIVKHSDTFKLYSDYVGKYHKVCETLRDQKQKNEKFSNFLKETSQKLKKDGQRIHQLSSYLILPIQRIPSNILLRYSFFLGYKLFLENLSKAGSIFNLRECIDLNLATEIINRVAKYCNRKTVQFKQEDQLKFLSDKFGINLVSPDFYRKLLKDSSIGGEEICFLKSKNEFCNCDIYLFNDILLIIEKEIQNKSGFSKLFVRRKKIKIDLHDDSTVFEENRKLCEELNINENSVLIINYEKKKKLVIKFLNRSIKKKWKGLIKNEMKNKTESRVNNKIDKNIVPKRNIVKPPQRKKKEKLSKINDGKSSKPKRVNKEVKKKVKQKSDLKKEREKERKERELQKKEEKRRKEREIMRKEKEKQKKKEREKKEMEKRELQKKKEMEKKEKEKRDLQKKKEVEKKELKKRKEKEKKEKEKRELQKKKEKEKEKKKKEKEKKKNQVNKKKKKTKNEDNNSNFNIWNISKKKKGCNDPPKKRKTRQSSEIPSKEFWKKRDKEIKKGKNSKSHKRTFSLFKPKKKKPVKVEGTKDLQKFLEKKKKWRETKKYNKNVV